MISHLEYHCIQNPEKTAFVFLGATNQDTFLSYRELRLEVTLLGCYLKNNCSGNRVVLLYQNTRDFIIAFFACQFAGIIAVPVLFSRSKRQTDKIAKICSDCGATEMLSSCELKDFINQNKPSIFSSAPDAKVIFTDNLIQKNGKTDFTTAKLNPISFLQYTSGSTGSPKGVIISQDNLLFNQEMIREAYQTSNNTIFFSWLPFQHDMGLVGKILQNIFIGGTCVLMSPYEFIRKPIRWLEGISKYRATHSSAPNFAYDLCTTRISPEEALGLDLSSWKVAINGSEPINKLTLDRFSEHFSVSGFQANSFYPSYGLAEATLVVSGKKQTYTRSEIAKSREPVNADIIISKNGLVGLGEVGTGTNLIIANEGLPCKEEEEGEVFIKGKSVTAGYWNKDNSDLFCSINGEMLLRTGDTGFLYGRQLFITGRIKEQIIIRGQKFYPYEIEQHIASFLSNIERNGVCAFDLTDNENFVVVAELKRSALQQLSFESLFVEMDKLLLDYFGIYPYDIVLTGPLALPRTTSGKLMRVKCRERYKTGTLGEISSRLKTSDKFRISPNAAGNIIKDVLLGSSLSLEQYLTKLVSDKTKIKDIVAQSTFAEAGLDSIRTIELINKLSEDLGVRLETHRVFQMNSMADLVDLLEKLIWLIHAKPIGKEITL